MSLYLQLEGIMNCAISSSTRMTHALMVVRVRFFESGRAIGMRCQLTRQNRRTSGVFSAVIVT